MNPAIHKDRDEIRSISEQVHPVLQQLIDAGLVTTVEFGQWPKDAERIRVLKHHLQVMIAYAKEPPVPPAPSHHCGPEGNCDCDCMNWAHFQNALVDAEKALRGA